MPEPSANVLTVFDIIKLLGNTSGLEILRTATAHIKSRMQRYEKICNVYRETTGFSKTCFWIFLFSIPKILKFVGCLLIIIAIYLIVLIFVPFVGALLQESKIGGFFVTNLQLIGWSGFCIALGGLGLLYLEPQMTFDLFQHWLEKRDIERILASRVRKDLAGVFRVDEENCEKIARGIVERLEKSPSWLFNTLLKFRNTDKETLSNELFIGEMFEALMHKDFGGDWKKFQPLQDLMADGNPVCSPKNILSKPTSNLVDTIKGFFESKGIQLSYTLSEALKWNLSLLMERYVGTALKVFEFQRPMHSRLSFALLGLFIGLIFSAEVPWVFNWIRHNSVMRIPAVYFYNATQVLSLVGSGLLFLIHRKAWVEWLMLKLRLVNKFQVTQKRLKSFKVFNERTVARLALAKFAYEYDLLKIDPKELRLGLAPSITLCLLKTRGLWTDADDLAASDEDLQKFVDKAMRRIAFFLEEAIEERIKKSAESFASLKWKGKESLVGEYYPYNIVDGFLYLTGWEYCSNDACLKGDECPFSKYKVCDAFEKRRFKYDRKDFRFLKEE